MYNASCLCMCGAKVGFAVAHVRKSRLFQCRDLVGNIFIPLHERFLFVCFLKPFSSALGQNFG